MTAVAVLPVAAVAARDLAEVERCVWERLGLAVRRLPPLGLPDGAYDVRRGQVEASLVLRAALASRPPDAVRVLAVIDRDLCVPVLSFVFGQAQLDGPAALVSLARLRPSYHGAAPDRGLFTARLRKEALHELGHTLGLIHCADEGCAMARSANVADIDRKTDTFCRPCGLRMAVGIEALRRGAGAPEVRT